MRGSVISNLLSASTEGVPPAQRAEYWQEAVCRAFVHLELECDRRQPFRAALEVRRTPTFDFIDVSGSPQRVTRSDRLIGADGEAALILMRQVQGSLQASQDGVDMYLGPGQIGWVDSRRPYSLCFDAAFSQRVVRLPLAALEARMTAGRRLPARLLRRDTSVSRLVFETIELLMTERREGFIAPLATAAFDLLGLALVERELNAVPERMAVLRVGWAKAFVIERLRDPLLGPQTVAAHQGVSLRLLQRLFAAESSSLDGFILEQRLIRAQRDLADTAQAARSVTEVALSWGFSDSAHFARSYRRRFGHSPREERIRARC